MSEAQNLPAPVTFDPASWLAEYEAIGGSANALRMWHQQKPGDLPTDAGIWLGITYPRDEGGKGWRLLETLNAGNASGEEGRRRNRALQDYLIETCGVVG